MISVPSMGNRPRFPPRHQRGVQHDGLLYLAQCWPPSELQHDGLLYLAQCWPPSELQHDGLLYLAQCWPPSELQHDGLLYLAQCWPPPELQHDGLLYLAQWLATTGVTARWPALSRSVAGHHRSYSTMACSISLSAGHHRSYSTMACSISLSGWPPSELQHDGLLYLAQWLATIGVTARWPALSRSVAATTGVTARWPALSRSVAATIGVETLTRPLSRHPPGIAHQFGDRMEPNSPAKGEGA